MPKHPRTCIVVGLAAVLVAACSTAMVAETTTDRFRRLFDELQATPVSCPGDLDRFGVAAEARCVGVTATFKQVRRAVSREFDKGGRLMDSWTRQDGYRGRIVIGRSEVFSIVYHVKAGILAVVPYRACPIDPTVHLGDEEDYEDPRVIEKVPPEHPTEALVVRLGGVVIVRVLIREDGGVGEVCVVGVEPPGYGFEEAAVQAIHKWRFEPAVVDGAVVPAYTIHYISWAIKSP